MSLTDKHQSFLKTIAKAIRARQLTKQNKNTQTYYLNISDNDGITINKIEGFEDIFWQSHQTELSITVAEFFDLLSAGYFRKARYEGNYYLNADKILADTQDTLSDNAVFALVATDSQFQCDVFMVMPFRDHLDPVYNEHIKPMVESLDLDIKRGDDPFSEHDIITEIWSLINNCQLIIADCTDKNTNVFYEMGLAHAIGKPVIPIAQNHEDIPFDIRQRRYIQYEATPEGLKSLTNELQRAIQSILNI
ncbi:MAG: hypothetical protein AAF846_13945 [Chloroflexota bacterium]